MNQQKRRFPPILIYLIFIAVLVIGAFVISNFGNRSESVTYTEYLKDLKEGQIKKAEIHQNNEVPTGIVYYTITDAKTAVPRAVPVPNVIEERNRLIDAGIENVVIMDVPGENLFLGTILPILIMGLLSYDRRRP